MLREELLENRRWDILMRKLNNIYGYMKNK